MWVGLNILEKIPIIAWSTNPVSKMYIGTLGTQGRGDVVAQVWWLSTGRIPPSFGGPQSAFSEGLQLIRRGPPTCFTQSLHI